MIDRYRILRWEWDSPEEGGWAPMGELTGTYDQADDLAASGELDTALIELPLLNVRLSLLLFTIDSPCFKKLGINSNIN